MTGAIHAGEPIWANGEPSRPSSLRVGDRVDSYGQNGVRSDRVLRVGQGSGKGTVWLHGASGAKIRCLYDQRVAVSIGGRRSYRKAGSIRIGDFLFGLVSGRLCVDPVVAIRTTVEAVPTVILEIPSVSLLSEEGILCRPAS